MTIYTHGCCDGDPRDPGTPKGRCCRPNGSCIDQVTKKECDYYRGEWTEGETCQDHVCPEGGVCCLPGGICRPSTEAYCEENGGTFVLGADCNDQPDPCDLPVSGACCLQDGTCVDATGETCDLLNGTFHPDTDCANTNPCDGACCLLSGACIVTDLATCNNLNGDFWPGGSCFPVFPCIGVPEEFGACCILGPNGMTCIDGITNVQCGQQGGIFWQNETCASPVLPCSTLWGSSVPEELLKIQKNNLTKQKSDTDVNNNSTAQQSDTNIKSDNTMQDDQIKSNVINAIESLKQEGVSLQDFDHPEKIAGLGDVVANVLGKFGLTQEYLQQALGFGWGCGCNERKSFLNKIFSFNKKE